MLRYSFLVSLFLIPFICSAQKDTTYYFLKKNGLQINNKDSADIIRMVVKPTAGEKLYMVHDKYPNGNSKLITHAVKEDGSVFQGYSLEFYPNGKKKSDENFVDDQLNGPINVYYTNGRLYMTGTFAFNGVLMINQCRDTSGTIMAADGTGEAVEYNDDITTVTARGMIRKSIKQGNWMHFSGNTLWYTILYRDGNMLKGTGYDNAGKEHPFMQLQEPLQFKNYYGLTDYLSGKLKYNNEAKKAGIRGSVHLNFAVEKDGTLTDIHVTEGLGYGLDEEAIRVLKLTAKMWVPAKQFGLPVRSELNVAVNFGLKTDHSSFKPISQ